MMTRIGLVLVAALLGLQAGTLDDSVKVSPLKKMRGKTAKIKPLETSGSVQRVPKLSTRQIMAAASAQGVRKGLGVQDFLHLDARSSYVHNKGFIYSWAIVDPEDNRFQVSEAHSVFRVCFYAKPEPATYVVDIQLAYPRDPKAEAEFIESVDGVDSTVIIDSGKKHLVYLLECEGGRHSVQLILRSGRRVVVTGVDVSLLD